MSYRISSSPSSTTTLLLLLAISSLLQRCFGVDLLRIPDCHGAEPRNWNHGTLAHNCPAWGSDTGRQLCINGFSNDHIQCFHYHCSCAYDQDGIPNLVCVGPLLDFQASIAPLDTPGISRWGESLWCQSLCRCPRLTREEDEVNYAHHQLEATIDDMLRGGSHQGEYCMSSSGDECPEGERCRIVAETIRGSLSLPRTFKAVCMSAVTAAAMLSASSSKHRLGGRSAEEGPSHISDSSMNLLSFCACNASYVSLACCDGGTDGMIWEAPGLKMGELDTDL